MCHWLSRRQCRIMFHQPELDRSLTSPTAVSSRHFSTFSCGCESREARICLHCPPWWISLQLSFWMYKVWIKKPMHWATTRAFLPTLFHSPHQCTPGYLVVSSDGVRFRKLHVSGKHPRWPLLPSSGSSAGIATASARWPTGLDWEHLA